MANRKIPPHIKIACKKWNIDGTALDESAICLLVDETFDVDGNPKTDPNAFGYQLSEKTVTRWMRGNPNKDEEPWINWKAVDDLPLTANEDDNHDVSHIKDAVLHFSILEAERLVNRFYSHRLAKDAKGRKEIIRKVLLEVQMRTRPKGRVLAYLAKTYLPDYIRRFDRDSDLRWAAVTPSLEDENTVDEILKEVGEQ